MNKKFSFVMIAAALGVAVIGAETRDPALWPFDAKSPWNYPIGSEAKYVPVECGFNNKQSNGSIVNCLRYSISLYQAVPEDPIRRVHTWHGTNGDQFNGKIRIPDGAAPSLGTDKHLAIIDETGRYVVEIGLTQRKTVKTNGKDEEILTGWLAFRNDLTDMGIYDAIHGTRAFGGSALGGLIRKGELTKGIPHALAIATDPSNLNSNAPGGKTFVWPACASDYEFPQSLWPPNTKPYRDWYSKRGNMYIGTLLAIPPDVDITKLGFGDSGPTYEIAKALQDYGGYVIDMGGAPLIVYAEPAAADEMGPLNAGGGASLKLDLLVPHLRIVANNAPDRVGGGGTPRRPFAPDFTPEHKKSDSETHVKE